MCTKNVVQDIGRMPLSYCSVNLPGLLYPVRRRKNLFADHHCMPQRNVECSILPQWFFNACVFFLVFVCAQACSNPNARTPLIGLFLISNGQSPHFRTQKNRTRHLRARQRIVGRTTDQGGAARIAVTASGGNK